MTITEILNIIHTERVETEILQALQQWLLNDRSSWINRAMDSEATIKAIKNIAEKTQNTKNALDGIVNLCSEE